MGNFQKSMLIAGAVQFSDDKLVQGLPRASTIFSSSHFPYQPFYTSLEDSSGFDDDGSSASISPWWSEVETVLSEANIRRLIQIWMREPTLPEDGAGPA